MMVKIPKKQIDHIESKRPGRTIILAKPSFRIIELHKKIYLWLIQFFYLATSRLSEKTRERGIVLCIFLMHALFLTNLSFVAFDNVPYLFLHLVFFGLAILLTIDQKYESLDFSWPQMMVFFLLGFGILLTAIHERSKTFFLFFLLFAFFYPLVAYVLDQAHLKKWIALFCRAYLLFVVLVVIGSFLFAPLTKKQYLSLFSDPNELSYIAILGILASYYLLGKVEKKSKKWAAYLLIGILLSFIIFTRSRTGILVSVLLLGLQGLKAILEKSFRWKRFVLQILAFVLLYLASFGFLTKLTPELEDFVKNSFHVDIQQSLQAKHGKDATSLLDFTEALYKRGTKGITTEGDFSSGRTAIWKQVLRHAGFFGHKEETIYEPNHFMHHMYAHNSILQVWYSWGMLACLAFLGLLVYDLLVSLLLLARLKMLGPDLVYILGVFLAYAIFMLLYSFQNPIFTPITFLFYLVSLVRWKDLPPKSLASQSPREKA